MKWAALIIFLLLLSGGAFLFIYNIVKDEKPGVIPQTTTIPVSTPQTTPISTPEATVSAEVTILEPKSNSTVTSPFLIKGHAPGNWLFEGQTTAVLQRKDGTEIATAVLLAETEWMTVEQVTFSGSMKFTKPTGVTEVNLVIKKDNPSGLPENDASFTIPLKLAQ